MSHPLAVTYLLEGTALFGGVKVVLQQADQLVRRGHRVTVVSREAAPAWTTVEADFVVDPGLRPDRLPPADVTVATFWTTVAPALASDRGEIAHYCQGFEASYTHNQAEHDDILAAYRHRLPTMAVSAHLVDLVRERFGRPGRVIPQPLEPAMRPGPEPTLDGASSDGQPGKPPRILVVSPYEIDWKGVATGLAAVKLLRQDGFDCRLIRLSQWPQSTEERADLAADSFHHHLAPPQVAELMRSCDLLLAPSWEQEGFGLPALEAMACGVPVVASDIPSFRSFAADAAVLVPHDRPGAFAAAARRLLENPELWAERRKAGLAVAARYREEHSARAAEEALRWVAEGRWRREP